MTTVNMHEAKTGLSSSSRPLKTEPSPKSSSPQRQAGGTHRAARGNPVVDVSKRLGIAEGQFGSFSLEEFNELDEEIARMMIEGPLFPDEPVVEPTKPKKSA